MTSQSSHGITWPIIGGLMIYLASGSLIYWLFYSNHPYDQFEDHGATAYKVWFWIAFASHFILTLSAAARTARFSRAAVVPSVIGMTFVLALLFVVTPHALLP